MENTEHSTDQSLQRKARRNTVPQSNRVANYDIAKQFDDNKTYAIGIFRGSRHTGKLEFDKNGFYRINYGSIWKSEGVNSFAQFLQENPYNITDLDSTYTLYEEMPDPENPEIRIAKYLAQGSIVQKAKPPIIVNNPVPYPSTEVAGFAGLQDKMIENTRELYENISRAKDNENQTLRGLLDQNNITNISAPFMQQLAAKDEQINRLLSQIQELHTDQADAIQERDTYWSEKFEKQETFYQGKLDAAERRYELANQEKNSTLTGFEAYRREREAEDKMHKEYTQKLQETTGKYESELEKANEGKGGLGGLDLNGLIPHFAPFLNKLLEQQLLNNNQTQTPAPQFSQNPNANYQYAAQPQNTMGLSQEQLDMLSKLPPDKQRDVMNQILNEKNASTMQYSEAQPNIVG